MAVAHVWRSVQNDVAAVARPRVLACSRGSLRTDHALSGRRASLLVFEHVQLLSRFQGLERPHLHSGGINLGERITPPQRSATRHRGGR
jgi:hypothetical protein